MNSEVGPLKDSSSKKLATILTLINMPLPSNQKKNWVCLERSNKLKILTEKYILLMLPK